MNIESHFLKNSATAWTDSPAKSSLADAGRQKTGDREQKNQRVKADYVKYPQV